MASANFFCFDGESGVILGVDKIEEVSVVGVTGVDGSERDSMGGACNK